MTPEEKAATADAAAFLGHFQHMWSEPFDERAWWKELEQWPFDIEEEKFQILANAADGDSIAASVLRRYAAKQIEKGEAIPECARKHIASFLVNGAPREKPGRKANDLQQRNFMIALEVLKLVHRGFRPTRNRASRGAGARESACSIVRQALVDIGVNMLTEDAVEKIWAKEADRVQQSDLGERLRQGRPVNYGIVGN